MNCMETNEPVRVGMIALGCNKNQVDAELMLGALEKEDFDFIPKGKTIYRLLKKIRLVK